MRIATVVGVALLVAGFYSAGPLAAARPKPTPMPTFHRSMMYLTPLRTQSGTQVAVVYPSGQRGSQSANVGNLFVTVSLKVANRNDVRMAIDISFSYVSDDL